MTELTLSAVTLAFWTAAGVTPASEAEIARIAGLADGDLPSGYVTFLETYGFPGWPDGSDAAFVSDLGPGAIRAMLDADAIGRVLDLDLVPPGHLPIADDGSGHGFVALRTDAAEAGSVWHVDDGGETGRIAPDFASFLADLAPDADPPEPDRHRGTPVHDPATGFTIAQETREAWAAYDTGSTPEPAGELAAIEDALGRPLPEALRTFLTTYGYVTFFGEAVATFDLPPAAGQPYDFLSVIYSTAVLSRSLPERPGAPLPFASTALPQGSLLIGLTSEDEGRIYWRGSEDGVPVPVAHDLRAFLADLYTIRDGDG